MVVLLLARQYFGCGPRTCIYVWAELTQYVERMDPHSLLLADVMVKAFRIESLNIECSAVYPASDDNVLGLFLSAMCVWTLVVYNCRHSY